MKELPALFSWIVDAFVKWLEAVRRPFATAETLLSQSESDSAKIGSALQLWLTAFILTLILQFPVLALFGIGLKHIEFHSTNFLVVLLALVTMGCLFHVGLRMFGIASKLPDTLVLYTIVVGSYSPLFTLLSYLSLYDTLAAIRTSKAAGHTMVEFLSVISSPARTANTELVANVLAFALSQVVAAAASTLLVLFAYGIRERYSCTHERALLAVSFSVFVLGIPMVVFTLLAMFVHYAFISS